MKRQFLFVVVIVCVFQNSCSRTFIVQASGSLDTGVRFEFFRGYEPSRLQITSLSVYSQDGSVPRTAEWKVEGNARVSDIDYGVAPKGLEERSSAVPLTIGGVYIVLAGDRIFFGPPGGGGTTFKITTTGAVIDCSQTPSCLSEI